MNERVMQFRIGMFVIVAGLVLTMLIIWFGESPTLFRNYGYLTVHYPEAPGVAIGIPVRKSGIRIGEVASIKFDDRPNQADGVLVTLALEPQYRVASGSVPRLGRALIGDVSIDMMPGEGKTALKLSKSPNESLASERIIEGVVAPDPSNALAAASKAFERAGSTLEAIEKAATGVSKLSANADQLDDFLATWSATGKKIGALSDEANQIITTNREQIQPTIQSLREASEKVNGMLDEETRQNVRTTAKNLASGSERLDTVLADVQPVAADLGAPYGTTPKTGLGNAVTRINRIAYEVSLLTSQLTDANGTRLNPNGTLQRLVMQSELHDNLNRAAVLIREILEATRPVMRNLTAFTERISRDPSVISRGVLQRN